MSVLKITKDNFETEVINSDKLVLLDFWASWSEPCKRVAPIIEEVAGETANLAIIGKVNVDEEPELVQVFKVMSIPTFAVMKNGKVVRSVVGVQSKQKILSIIQ